MPTPCVRTMAAAHPATLRTAVTCGLAALAAGAAHAHTGTDAGAHHGWLAGLLHPWTGLDHLAVMLAVGLWSAVGAGRRWLAPLTFTAMLGLGAVAAQQGWQLAAVEPMIVASMVVIGLLIALSLRLPQPWVAALVGGFAVFHGVAHGQELQGTQALAGMLVSTATLHGLGIGLGLWLQRRHAWLPRAGGAAVAAAGLVTAAGLW